MRAFQGVLPPRQNFLWLLPQVNFDHTFLSNTPLSSPAIGMESLIKYLHSFPMHMASKTWKCMRMKKEKTEYSF